MSLQLAPPILPPPFTLNIHCTTHNHPLTCHVNFNANDAPSHPTARMKHQSSPPALLDGTGLLQMPPQRAESSAAKQDNGTNWEHMRSTRNHQRQHEPNETPRHSATHTHLYGSNGGPPTVQYRPILHPQGPLVQASYNAQSPEGSFFGPKAHFFGFNWKARHTEGSFLFIFLPKAHFSGRRLTFSVLIGKRIPEAHVYLCVLPKAHLFLPKAHFLCLCFWRLVPSRRLITKHINGMNNRTKQRPRLRRGATRQPAPANGV